MPSRLSTAILPLLHVLIGTTAIIPALIIVAYIIEHGRNIPFWDEWDSDAPLVLTALHQGPPTLGDLAVQHNEHRIFVHRFITVLLAPLTHWNIKLALLVSVVFAAGYLMLTLVLFRRRAPKLVLLVALPLSALVFSLRISGGWTWALLDVFHTINLLLLAGLVVLDTLRVGWKALILLAGIAALASFSLFNGLAFWPIFAVGLVLYGYRHWRYYAGLSVAAALCLGLFLAGYRLPDMGFQLHEISLLRSPVVRRRLFCFL
jgi:hypothetical protein